MEGEDPKSSADLRTDEMESGRNAVGFSLRWRRNGSRSVEVEGCDPNPIPVFELQRRPVRGALGSSLRSERTRDGKGQL